MLCFAQNIFSKEHSFKNSQLFILTVPKSGTWLTAKAISNLSGINIHGGVMNHSLFSKEFLLNNPNYHTTAHLVSNFEPLKSKINVKKNVLVRDPRDICISAAYWLSTPGNNWYSYAIDHSRFHTLSYNEKISYFINSPKKHGEFSIQSFVRRLVNWLDIPGILVIKVEDLVGEKGSATLFL